MCEKVDVTLLRDYLLRSAAFNQAQRKELNRAFQYASGRLTLPEVGNVYVSSRGVRLLIKFSNPSYDYALVDLKTFEEGKNSGPGCTLQRYFRGLPAVQDYMDDHGYKFVSRIETLVAGLSYEETIRDS